MKALLEAAGVDYAQWLALTRALLKRDFRTRSSQMARGNRGPATGGKALFAQAIFYSVFGVVLSVAIVVSKDLFFIGLVMCSYVMFMVGTAVLLDHSSALTAADDYAVLGFRPVSSRTYFAVRLTNVLIYTLMMTTMVVYIPIGALFVTAPRLRSNCRLGVHRCGPVRRSRRVRLRTCQRDRARWWWKTKRRSRRRWPTRLATRDLWSTARQMAKTRSRGSNVRRMT